jgi:hypothetical protein
MKGSVFTVRLSGSSDSLATPKQQPILLRGTKRAPFRYSLNERNRINPAVRFKGHSAIFPRVAF